MNRKRNVQFQKGFTLLEIMLVVVIIGLLAGLLIYNLAGTSDQARIDIARSACKGPLATAIGLYQLHTGSYPSSLEDLITKPADASNWRGPYLKEKPIDPWNEPYQYRYPGTHNPSGFDVYSKGLDKMDGTADDIGNWSESTN